MLRRTSALALQRTRATLAAAAEKPKAPEMTAKRGAIGTEGDSVLDKAVLLVSLGAVVAWWTTVSGPQHQH